MIKSLDFVVIYTKLSYSMITNDVVRNNIYYTNFEKLNHFFFYPIYLVFFILTMIFTPTASSS